jgi:hypothetical protein
MKRIGFTLKKKKEKRRQKNDLDGSTLTLLCPVD